MLTGVCKYTPSHEVHTEDVAHYPPGLRPRGRSALSLLDLDPGRILSISPCWTDWVYPLKCKCSDVEGATVRVQLAALLPAHIQLLREAWEILSIAHGLRVCLIAFRSRRIIRGLWDFWRTIPQTTSIFPFIWLRIEYSDWYADLKAVHQLRSSRKMDGVLGEGKLSKSQSWQAIQ